MANLPNQANRLNDIEVSASAPLTETLFRRLGSNINYILDFLGVSNGATSTAGALGAFVSALSLVENHNMNLLYTSITTGSNTTSSQSIGTLNSVKFVNQIIYAVFPAGQTTLPFYGETSFTNGMTSISRFFITKRKNGTGPITIPNFQADTISGALGLLGGAGTAPGHFDYTPQGSALRNSHVDAYTNFTISGNTTDKPQNESAPTTPVAASLDYRVASNRPWMQVAELDWREGSSWLLQHHHVNVGTSFTPTPQVQYYRAYKLSVESGGLIY